MMTWRGQVDELLRKAMQERQKYAHRYYWSGYARALRKALASRCRSEVVDSDEIANEERVLQQGGDVVFPIEQRRLGRSDASRALSELGSANWEQQAQQLLDAAVNHLKETFIVVYWDGYVEALQELLETGIKGLSEKVSEREEILEFARRRMGEKAGPFQHERGRVDALREALRLLMADEPK